MVKVFLTGATGYVGGTALHHIIAAQPSWEYTLLIRNEDRAQKLKDRYPDVEFLYGSLSDTALIENAASEADVVVHAASGGDASAAEAIGRGIKKSHTASNPGYWIHTSGTGSLTWYDFAHKRAGEAPLPDQYYTDIDGIDRVLALPDEAPHRKMERVVQSYASDSVKVAIICPPTIYGPGSGVGNTRSVQTPQLTQMTLEQGFAPVVSPGKTEWNHVHIDDLADVFVRLIAASQDPLKNSNPQIFGPEAYFFTEVGYHLWADVAAWVANEAHHQGYLAEPLVKMITNEEAHRTGVFAAITWGVNSRSTAQRARKFLDWTPRAISYKESIPELVTQEAKALGLVPKEKMDE